MTVYIVYTGEGAGDKGPLNIQLFLSFHMGPKHWEDSKCGREPGNLNVLPNIICSV